MIRLRVWLRFPDGEAVQAGELIVAEPDERRGGRLLGEFRYLPDYLERPGAFALDPLQLLLEPQVFPVNRLHAGIHGVFEDSLPDAWGRRILCIRYGLGAAESRPPSLLARIGSEALGALAFSVGPEWAEAPPSESVTALSELMDAARRFEDAPPGSGGTPLHGVGMVSRRSTIECKRLGLTVSSCDRWT